MSAIPPYLAKIKPVYDVSNYGTDLTVELGIDNLTSQSITASTAAFFKNTDSINLSGSATTVYPVEDMDLVLSDVDVFGVIHEGNNTTFDRIYAFEPDMTAMVYKISMKAAFALNVSAFTNGSSDIDSVRVIIKQQVNSELTENLDDFVIPATLTALTATGTQIFIILADRHYSNFKVQKGRPVTIQIVVNENQSGTNTRQVGLMPCFPFQAAAILKPVTTSSITMHIHATLDHAFPIFRDQNSMQLLDYSGVTNDDGGGVG